MQRDKDLVNKGDMRNVMRGQKEELAALRAEVEELRHCKKDSMRVPVLEKTIQSMHRAQEALEAKLKDRDAIVAMYQEKEAAKLREEELARERQAQKDLV